MLPKFDSNPVLCAPLQISFVQTFTFLFLTATVSADHGAVLTTSNCKQKLLIAISSLSRGSSGKFLTERVLSEEQSYNQITPPSGLCLLASLPLPLFLPMEISRSRTYSYSYYTWSNLFWLLLWACFLCPTVLSTYVPFLEQVRPLLNQFL